MVQSFKPKGFLMGTDRKEGVYYEKQYRIKERYYGDRPPGISGI